MSVKCVLTNQLSKGELDGYLPLNGGTLTGRLVMDNGWTINLEDSDKYNIMLDGLNGMSNFEISDKNNLTAGTVGLFLSANSDIDLFDPGLYAKLGASLFHIYHEGYKPLPADIGAVATDIPMTFSINASGGLTVTY